MHAVYRTRRAADPGGQRWWQADLADLEEVRNIVSQARPEVIFHLASHVKGAPGLEHVLPTFQSNLQSTVNMLTLAAGIRLLSRDIDRLSGRAGSGEWGDIPFGTLCCREMGQ